ncbi:GATOR2 complex protein Wdr59-like [Cochliomyia hominivorax]
MVDMIYCPSASVPQTESMKYEMTINEDPFKKCFLEAFIMHFASECDLQTAVMLACLFHPFAINGIGSCGSNAMNIASSSKSNFMAVSVNYCSYQLPNFTPNTSPYHTVLRITIKKE